MRTSHRLGVLLLSGGALLAPGCGSSSSPVSPSPVTTMAPAPVTTALFTGSHTDIEPSGVYYINVSAPSAGTLTAHFGWTTAGDSFSAAWYQGACPACTVMSTTFTPGTRTSATASAVITQAGTYAFVFSPSASDQKEAVSLQITFTTP